MQGDLRPVTIRARTGTVFRPAASAIVIDALPRVLMVRAPFITHSIQHVPPGSQPFVEIGLGMSGGYQTLGR